MQLLPPHKVREHVGANKDDAADARGTWLAANQGDIRRVSIKSAQQQATLAAHRLRSHWVSMRTSGTPAQRSTGRCPARAASPLPQIIHGDFHRPARTSPPLTTPSATSPVTSSIAPPCTATAANASSTASKDD